MYAGAEKRREEEEEEDRHGAHIQSIIANAERVVI